MGELMQRSVDLLDLSPESDPEVLLNQIMRQESMIKEAHREPLRKLLFKLQDKLAQVGPARYCSPCDRVCMQRGADSGACDARGCWSIARVESTVSMAAHADVIGCHLTQDTRMC
jgi:hypothetical protein